MKILKQFREATIYLALIILVIFFSLTSKNFFQFSNFLNIVNQVCVMGIMAIGMTFVIISGNIDLSVGCQVSLSNIIMGYLMVNMGVPPIIAILAGVLICCFVGLLNGLIVNKIGIFAMIATLGMMQICKGISYSICGGMPIFGFPQGVNYVGQHSWAGVPVSVFLFIFLMVAVSLFLTRTYLGRWFFSVGGNAEASRLSGIPTMSVKIMAYVVCGFFTGIASFVTMSRLNCSLAASGIGSEMDVITAVVLGGVSMNGGEGKLSGVFAGVLIMGVLSNGLVMIGANDYVQMIIKGLVLLFSLSVDQLKKFSFKKPVAT